MGIVSLWLLFGKERGSLEVRKEAPGQRTHRSSDLGMLASALLHAGSATVKDEAFTDSVGSIFPYLNITALALCQQRRPQLPSPPPAGGSGFVSSGSTRSSYHGQIPNSLG